MKKEVNPDRMIQIIQKYFKDSLSKPNLKNLSLTTRAMAKSEKLTINEIARKMNYMNHFDSNYIIRVPKNCGIVGMEYKGKLSSFYHFGYFRDMYYHIKKQVKVNLYSAKNPSDDSDPYFMVSNIDTSFSVS